MVGLMRDIFQFSNPTKTSDGYGGQTVEYDEFFRCRGELTKNSGNRNFSLGYDAFEGRYRARVHYRNVIESNIQKDTRIYIDNRNFSIDDYTVTKDRKFIEFELSTAE